MKTIYIFTRLPNAYAPKRLLEEAVKLGHTGKIIDYSKVVFSIQNGELSVLFEGVELNLPDAVVFRAPGMDGFCTATRDALLSFFRSKNIRVLNGETFARWSSLDKLTQHIEFEKAGILAIDSIVYTDLTLLKSSIKTFPTIVKSYLGSHGDGVKKISKESDLDKLEQSDAPFLVQPFLKAGRDVRAIVMGKKVLGAMLRVAQDGHYLTNFSAGGAVELFDLNDKPEVVELSLKTAKCFECEYAGVDLMQDDGGVWRILEINRSCQFEGFEQATGDNVASKLIEYVLSS